MNSHLFSMVQKYSGKCSTSHKLHVCFLFNARNWKFQNACFFIFLTFWVDLMLCAPCGFVTCISCYYTPTTLFVVSVNRGCLWHTHLNICTGIIFSIYPANVGCVCHELYISVCMLFCVNVYFRYIHTLHFLVTRIYVIVCHLFLSCVCHVFSSFSGSY